MSQTERSGHVRLIVIGSIVFGIATALMVFLFLRASDPSWVVWPSLICYLVSVVGLVVLMRGLTGVPDRLDSDGMVHHRAQILLIWFGATILTITVLVYGTLLLVAGVVGLGTAFMIGPLGLIGATFIATLLVIPMVAVAAVYICSGISILIRRKTRERRGRLATATSRPQSPASKSSADTKK